LTVRTTSPNTDRSEEFDTRRIILLRGHHLMVLLDHDGTRCALPSLTIPRWQRVAENLTASLRGTCGLAAVSLGSVTVPCVESASEAILYELMEACAPGAEAPLGKHWVTVAGLSEAGFRDPLDFHALRQAVAQAAGDIEITPHTPFGRLGWFEEVKNWVQEQLGPHGLHLNGRFRQLNASPAFSLIRFETNGPAVWFKAVGSPNEREFPLTLALARLFPRFVPAILGSRPDWNAWLAREAEGPLLSDESCRLTSWKAAARDLAELQIDSLGRSLHLLEAGARDLRTPALSARVTPFFETATDLMERQVKTSPAPLTREDLGRLSRQVQEALAVVKESNIPASLGHLDFNPGNIIAPLTGCVFLDWAEASVAHPFLTFENLREHFRRTFGPDTTQESNLVSSYSFAWRAFGSEDEVQQALEVSRLLAVFAYAAGSDLWSNLQTREQAQAAAFLRSLTRRMDREACALAERSMPCPS
jgi:hypothetical protein